MASTAATKTQVKRPANRDLVGKEKELFDRLENITNTYKIKDQCDAGLKAVEELAEELEQSSVVIPEKRELKREVTRHLQLYKMESVDQRAKKEREESMAQGTDQVSQAKKDPTPAQEGERQSTPDDGGCTIGVTGQYIFYAGLLAVTGYVAYRLLKKE